MDSMLNNGGHANGNAIGTEEGTQAEPYDIEGHPFFDMATADCTTFFVDGQGEDESKDEDDDTDPDGDMPEDATATTTGDDPAAKKKKISKRIIGYTAKKDVCLCRSWLAISQDATSWVTENPALASPTWYVLLLMSKGCVPILCCMSDHHSMILVGPSSL
jgi:hypothetical protein